MVDGYLDLLSETAQGDTCLVLPTLNHAINIWPIVKTMFREKVSYDDRIVAMTRAAIVCKPTRTVMRLWVPYERDPTMPMDYPIEFAWHCTYMSVWFSPKEIRRLVLARRTTFSVRERGDIEASRAIYKRHRNQSA